MTRSKDKHGKKRQNWHNAMKPSKKWDHEQQETGFAQVNQKLDYSQPTKRSLEPAAEKIEEKPNYEELREFEDEQEFRRRPRNEDEEYYSF